MPNGAEPKPSTYTPMLNVGVLLSSAILMIAQPESPAAQKNSNVLGLQFECQLKA
jgi:hypothetical protein